MQKTKGGFKAIMDMDVSLPAYFSFELYCIHRKINYVHLTPIVLHEHVIQKSIHERKWSITKRHKFLMELKLDYNVWQLFLSISAVKF